MVGFYTKFTTEKVNRPALLEILSEAAISMQSVEGCKLYIVNKDVVDETATWVTEIWTTKEAHTDSLKSEVAKSLIAKALPLLVGKPEQIQLLPVSNAGIFD